MNFNEIDPEIYEFAKAKMFEVVRNGSNELVIRANYDKLPTEELKKIARKFLSATNIQHVYTVVKAIEHGIKILQPTTLDFCLLEMTDLNIDVSDYNQPFETIVLELPKKYRESRIFDMKQNLHVDSVIISHMKTENMIFIMLIGPDNFSAGITFTNEKETIEEQIQQKERLHGTQMNLWQIVRASLNACLIMDEYGVTIVGPLHSNYYAQLQRQVAKAASKRVASLIRTRMNRHPTLYKIITLFNKEVLAYQKVISEATEHKEPHWRRGHYRMQPYGPGNRLRKRIRIAPVFVNYRFGEQNVTTRYRTGE